jgi:hypothetical protein
MSGPTRGSCKPRSGWRRLTPQRPSGLSSAARDPRVSACASGWAPSCERWVTDSAGMTWRTAALTPPAERPADSSPIHDRRRDRNSRDVLADPRGRRTAHARRMAGSSAADSGCVPDPPHRGDRDRAGGDRRASRRQAAGWAVAGGDPGPDGSARDGQSHRHDRAPHPDRDRRWPLRAGRDPEPARVRAFDGATRLARQPSRPRYDEAAAHPRRRGPPAAALPAPGGDAYERSTRRTASTQPWSSSPQGSALGTRFGLSRNTGVRPKTWSVAK